MSGDANDDGAPSGSASAEPLLFGQVYTRLAPAELATALTGAGIAASVRESSLFTGGRYVSVDAADATFSLERIEADEYLARGDAEWIDALQAVARAVSAALARLGLRHRFELYENRDRLVMYLHHRWPRTERIGPDQAAAVHTVLAACGADLARQGFRNWDPPYPLDRLLGDVDAREVWAVWMDDAIAATFTLGTVPPHPDDPPPWRRADAPALYLSRLAVHPAARGHGLGAWCMGEVERRARELGCRAVRFDVLAANTRVRAFYERLGYELRGERTRGPFTFACYDKLLD